MFTILEVCVKFLVLDSIFLQLSEELYYFLGSYMDGILYIYKRIMLNFVTSIENLYYCKRILLTFLT